MHNRRSHRGSLALLFAALVLLTACASSRLHKDQQAAAERLIRHYILVHEDGHAFEPLGRRDVLFRLGDDRQPVSTHDDQPCAVRLLGSPREKSAGLEPLVARHVVEGLDVEARAIAKHNRECGSNAQCKRPLRILIFVHGGMNGYRDHFKRMKRLLKYDPAKPDVAARLRWGPDHYPIFINWNAGLGDSIADDLFFIRFGLRVHPAVGIVTSPFVIGARIASSVVGAPVAWMHTINNYVDSLKDDDFGAREEHISDAEREANFGTNALFVVPRAVTTPVMEAFGTPAWKVMKRRAQLATAQRLPRNNCATEGAARTLLKALQARLTPRKSFTPRETTTHDIVPQWTVDKETQVPAEITMVGHSMGAIIVNRLLAAVHPLRVHQIVYLAPAAGIDDFEGFLLPYLAHHPETRFALFSLSRRNEARESTYHVEPRGTLLAWIDTLFERGWTMGQMTHGRATNVFGYYGIDPGDSAIEDIWRKIPLQDLVLERKPPPPDVALEPTCPVERIKAYVARNVPNAPRKHGDFDGRHVLRDVLCRVDPAAFGPGVCPDRRPMSACSKAESGDPADR